MGGIALPPTVPNLHLMRKMQLLLKKPYQLVFYCFSSMQIA
jgi:hypothetical protein